jgi:hypothetical protein
MAMALVSLSARKGQSIVQRILKVEIGCHIKAEKFAITTIPRLAATKPIVYIGIFVLRVLARATPWLSVRAAVIL